MDTRARRALAGLAASVLVLNPLAANAISCTGQIGYLGYDQNRAVVIANGTNIHTICSSTAQGNFQINTTACKGFYATLLVHRLAAKPVTIYYNDPALTSCSQIGSWSNQPSAYFIQMAD
ncbi:hypothetical protein [Mitsuaria sp. GD03876]|uniref:hypothetical protein n=1 Tax=Mitsuaria sp. GD03876 TaxID=2975399 RepID=UPI0024483FFE|nr:hypothetical protein [Mitsuaria sp. GD03876]MDH0867078.1 hypothetical protein [Mitsuaria sp. GD03876]